MRYLEKNFGAYFNTDKLYEQIYGKNFKKFYAGKPTKRYQKILDQLEKAKSISHEDIERLII